MEEADKEVSVADWVFTIIILSVPVVNFGFALYWALSDKAKKTKKNYARAWFIVMGLIILFWFLISLLSTGGTGQEIQAVNFYIAG